MAAQKKIRSRLINKHATAAVWDNSNFKPLQAQVIVYDKDQSTGRERIKVGDGATPVKDLPFITTHEHTFTGTQQTLNVTPAGSVATTVTYDKVTGLDVALTTECKESVLTIGVAKTLTQQPTLATATSSFTGTEQQIKYTPEGQISNWD